MVDIDHSRMPADAGHRHPQFRLREELLSMSSVHASDPIKDLPQLEMPAAPEMPNVEVQPVAVPEPQLLPDEPVGPDAVQSLEPVEAPSLEQPAVAAVPVPAAAPAAVPPVAPSKLDANSLPISWSVQLASLSSSDGAQKLQKTLRSQGYNAYIRSVDGMNRVFVGPLIERAEADRLRDQLNRQHKLNGFVVRFQPEAG